MAAVERVEHGPMTARGLHRLATIMAGVVVIVVLLLAGLATYQWGRASAKADSAAEVAAASKQTDDLNACRASFRGELVDEPFAKALRAITLQDDTAIQEAGRQADVVGYLKLVDLSRQQPGEFIRMCHSTFG